jgi:hypothetical protein
MPGWLRTRLFAVDALIRVLRRRGEWRGVALRVAWWNCSMCTAVRWVGAKRAGWGTADDLGCCPERCNRPAVTGSCKVLGLCVWDLITGSVVVVGRMDRHVRTGTMHQHQCVASTCSAALIAGFYSAMQQRQGWPGFGVGLVCWLSVCWSISELYTLDTPLQQCVE